MALIELTSILTVILFGTISIFLSKKESATKKELLERERNQKQRLYEIAILKEIQERIGYELNVEKVIDVITGSLRNLFPYSTSSSLFIKEDRLVFKTYVEESVSHDFIEQVKKNSVNSLSAIYENQLPTEIDESISGVVLDDTNNSILASFFNIPLDVNNNVVGIINVSSTRPGLYKEDEMTILYRITTQASNALSRLQEVLKTEKGKLMSLIGSLADGVFMLDANNNHVLVINDAAKSILKIKKNEAGIVDILSSLPKTYDLLSKIKEATINNKTIEEKEIQIEEKTVQVFITPVLDTKTNKVIGVSVLLHDITLEKNLSRLKEDFTNMMVHELRSPLTAIKDASSFVLTGSPEKEETGKMLNIVHDQSKLLLDYVSSLLDAAKIEGGRFIIQKKPGSIKETIEKSIDVFRPVAKTKNVNLEVNIEDLLPASFDSVRIGQVLNNLLSNSLKFTPDGGKITVNARTSGNNISVSVSDTGVGIPKEKQGELFSKFAQVLHPGSQTSSGGTGLGLYIAKGIVEAHGGVISLDSDTGRGTTISFTLPADTVAKAAEEQKPTPAPPVNLASSYGPN